MNFVENNGKKVAAVLCVASCFPVVATVYAMETEPGWHGDKFINEDETVAKGWQEIEGKSYYFDEEGTVDQETTKKAVVASVSAKVAEDVKAEVETKVAEEVVAQNEAVEVIVPEVQELVQPETPVVPEVQEPVQPEAPVVPEVQELVQPEAPVVPEVQEPVQPEAPVVPEVQEPVVDAQAALNQRIVDEALKLVGVTDGQWCTEVATQALVNAGVSAGVVWPDQYVAYGTPVDASQAQAGNLIYYNNGGRGVDHIAIYIGDGLAVHGNYNGKTVVAEAFLEGSTSIQFIQVNAQ